MVNTTANVEGSHHCYRFSCSCVSLAQSVSCPLQDINVDIITGTICSLRAIILFHSNISLDLILLILLKHSFKILLVARPLKEIFSYMPRYLNKILLH